MQTLSLPGLQYQSLLLSVATNLITATRFNAAEQADQSLGDAVALGDLSGSLFFNCADWKAGR